jgi:hypothetical protein
VNNGFLSFVYIERFPFRLDRKSVQCFLIVDTTRFCGIFTRESCTTIASFSFHL